MGFSMHAAPDALFKTLADPTRRAIFDRLCRDGEQTVRALTDPANYLGAAPNMVDRMLAGR